MKKIIIALMLFITIISSTINASASTLISDIPDFAAWWENNQGRTLEEFGAKYYAILRNVGNGNLRFMIFGKIPEITYNNGYLLTCETQVSRVDYNIATKEYSFSFNNLATHGNDKTVWNEVLYSNFDLYVNWQDGTREMVFQQAPLDTMPQAAIGGGMLTGHQMVMMILKPMARIVPSILVVVVSLVGLVKAWQMLKRVLSER